MSIVAIGRLSQIICMADVETASGVLQNVHAEHSKMAPAVGFEPTTNRLTADRSTTELRWIALGDAEHTLASPFVQGKRRFGTKEKLLTQHSSKKLVAGAGFEPATFGL